MGPQLLPCCRLLQLVRFQQLELAEVPSAALSGFCGLPLLPMLIQWHEDPVCQEANLSLQSWVVLLDLRLLPVSAGAGCRSHSCSCLARGRKNFLARWDCDSQNFNVFKLLWNSTLKLWFHMCFQSALLVGEATSAPSMGLFLAGLGPWSGSQQKPAGRSASMMQQLKNGWAQVTGGMAGGVDWSCVTAAHTDLESVGAVGQQKAPSAHKKELCVSPWCTPGCLCCGVTATLVPCYLPGLGLLSGLLLPREFWVTEMFLREFHLQRCGFI